MKKKEVFILSGDIQSGKTTSLSKWSATRNDVYGILTPIENGKRFFMDISSGEKFSMEANADEIATIQVGKYSFSMNSFSERISEFETDSCCPEFNQRRCHCTLFIGQTFNQKS